MCVLCLLCVRNVRADPQTNTHAHTHSKTLAARSSGRSSRSTRGRRRSCASWSSRSTPRASRGSSSEVWRRPWRRRLIDRGGARIKGAGLQHTHAPARHIRVIHPNLVSACLFLPLRAKQNPQSQSHPSRMRQQVDSPLGALAASSPARELTSMPQSLKSPDQGTSDRIADIQSWSMRRPPPRCARIESAPAHPHARSHWQGGKLLLPSRD